MNKAQSEMTDQQYGQIMAAAMPLIATQGTSKREFQLAAADNRFLHESICLLDTVMLVGVFQYS